MNNFFLISILSIFIVANINVLSLHASDGCSNITNVVKKIKCKIGSTTKNTTSKVDSATEGITSKKTLADFFKNKNDD